MAADRRVGGVLVAAALLLAGCAGEAATAPTGTPDAPALTDPSAVVVTTVDSPAVPAADLAAIVELFEVVNAAAGGDPADQGAALLSVMTPGSVAGQQACRAATVTAEFQPVREAVVPDPDHQPAEGTDAGGTAYRVPTRVEVFSGGRRVGTDLALVRVQVVDGRALTFPLCLS